MATFGQPFGLNGEIKINILISSFETFKSLDDYLSDDELTKWKFDKMKIINNKCVVHPVGCNNRNEADLLRNKKIFSYYNKLFKTSFNEYYVKDLLICDIFLQNGILIGKVLNVENFGAGNLLETKYKNQNIYIPINKENIVSIDIDKKIIIANPIKGILN